MTPHAALRKLEALVRTSDLPHEPALEAEDCLSTLWRYVLLGKDKQDV
jgi:hypothetical protein